MGLFGPASNPDSIQSKIQNPFSSKTSSFQGLERGPDFAAGFQIVEVIDGVEQTGNKLALAGNLLPMVPFEWGGEQRLTKEYYPGNPEAAVQVMGGKEGDVTIHGRFKDKRYKDSSLYGVSYKIAEQVDILRRRGNLVKISLGEWVRYAFIEKCDFKLAKLSDIEYSIQFFIVGFTLPTNGKIVARSKELPLDLNNALISAALDFQAKYGKDGIPITVPRSIADVLNGAISSVAHAVGLVTGFVDTVLTTAEDVQKSANRALGLIKNARTTICQTQRRLGNLSTGFNSISNQTKASQSFRSAFINQEHLVKTISAAGALAALLASLQAQFNAIAKTVPLARYKVKAGDTLQKIAVKFYNNADLWSNIYDHNNLTTTALTPGMLLEIPKV